MSSGTWHETPSCGNGWGVPLGPSTFASTASPAQTGRRGGADLHWLWGKLDHMLHTLAVVMPRLLLIDHIPLVLGEVQEATDGTKVLPEGAVFWAGVLLPAKQLTQPALEKERRSPELTCRVHRGKGAGGLCLQTSAIPLPHSFPSYLFPPTWEGTETDWQL